MQSQRFSKADEDYNRYGIKELSYKRFAVVVISKTHE